MAQLGNVDLPTSSEYAKEMVKHEALHTKYGPPGRPYEFRAYPTRMYRFYRDDKGQRAYEGDDARDDHERSVLEAKGFVHGGLAPALEAFEKIEAHAAQLHAEIVYDQKKRMSDGAAKEIAAARESVAGSHLTEVPATPVKRRGRPAKAVTAE